MRGEPPSNHELLKPTIRIRRDPANPNINDWDYFRPQGGISLPESEAALTALLSKSFVKQTLAHLPGATAHDVTTLTATLIQQGIKNTIYRVDTNGHTFTVIQSRGTLGLNEEANNDFNNICTVWEQFTRAGFPPLTPKPFALGQGNGISGFSTEFLPDHIEVGIFPDANRQEPSPTGRVILNPYSFEAQGLGEPRAEEFISARFTNPGLYEGRGNLLKETMIAKLFAMQQLLGKLPQEFSINAGDFMANPDMDDYDLRLITIRGGFETISFDEFFDWVYTRTDRMRDNNTGELIDFPSFDLNHELIQIGIETGFRQLDKYGIEPNLD